MDRRRDKRWPRHLDVKYWREGEAPHRSVITNISRGGVFIRTSSLFPSGTRLRLEVLHHRNSFLVEAVVVRALKTPSHLQTVKPSGMGLRFLLPAELVEDLLPAHARSSSVQTAVDPAAAGAEGGRAADGSSVQSPRPVERIDVDRQLFQVTFDSAEQFRAVFERDIQTGGLFVPTLRPAPLDQVVRVEVVVAGMDDPVRVEARVVHSVLPADGEEDADGNLLVGMGVHFTDALRAVQQLRRLLKRG